MSLAPSHTGQPVPIGERFPQASRFVSSDVALWVAFAAVHILLCLLALLADGLPLGDVTLVYKMWAQHAVADSFIVGIDSAWVYPIVALVPIMGAAVFGFWAYEFTWLAIVVILNGLAFGALIGRGTRPAHPRVAWWWLAFLALLGPIALGRIDSITVPLVILALLWVSDRPRAAGVLLTTATWIKVWPAAIIATVFIAARHRWQLFMTVVVTSVAIVFVACVLGGAANVFSFISQQTGRGLQIESPVSSIWLWRAVFHDPGSSLYYDNDLLTFQVAGTGVDLVSGLMTPLLAVAVIAVTLIGALAVRAGASFTAVLPSLSLAMVATLIAFNKVGSPQFVAWLAAPVIIGLVLRGRDFRTPAVLVALVGLLTQVVYPYLYGYLLRLDAPMVAVLTVRNLLYFVIIGWAVHALWALREQSEV